MAVQNYFLPQSVDEAVELLAAHGDSLLVMAGGTLTMPLINDGISAPEKVMGLRQAGLNYTGMANGSVILGATATLSQVIEHGHIPMLRQAASSAASWTIRNMGTVGGNLFAPPPAGDLAVALLALDAELNLHSARGSRSVPLADFYKGFMSTVMAKDELLLEIEVPAPLGRTAYVKYGRKHSHTPSVVTVAAHLVLDDGLVTKARIALGAVGPHPLRAQAAESYLQGKTLSESHIASAASIASEECEPFTDAIASEWYRRRMVKVYVARMLQQIAAEEASS
ncbi:MAG: FAD binding domain-containing protein [Caldilineales bacterium]|nr:FAD binding domain-containing protein [Caldilineales bacterium]